MNHHPPNQEWYSWKWKSWKSLLIEKLERKFVLINFFSSFCYRQLVGRILVDIFRNAVDHCTGLNVSEVMQPVHKLVNDTGELPADVQICLKQLHQWGLEINNKWTQSSLGNHCTFACFPDFCTIYVTILLKLVYLSNDYYIWKLLKFNVPWEDTYSLTAVWNNYR